MKKTYAKPALTTRALALGVFGSYNSDGGHDGRAAPARNLTDRNLQMD